jgi:hypothetical protein
MNSEGFIASLIAQKCRVPQQPFIDLGFAEVSSCSLKTINNPIEACGGGYQFLVIFQRD